MVQADPNDHHYVPKFYLRRFACADDVNKVSILERHRDAISADRKSIDRIGYEERLHDYQSDGRSASIEGVLNKAIETPFSKSSTWRKIVTGHCAELREEDRLPLYGFARHLQLRNVQMLRFIESQSRRFLAGELDAELTQEERDMHLWISSTPGAAHELFRAGVLATSLPADAASVTVMVCEAPIPLRSSTNPTITLSHPGSPSPFSAIFGASRTWWLPLNCQWGTLIIATGSAAFSICALPIEPVQLINRYYVTQLLEGDARYTIANDQFIEEDLRWAGFALAPQPASGSRYRARYKKKRN